MKLKVGTSEYEKRKNDVMVLADVYEWNFVPIPKDQAASGMLVYHKKNATIRIFATTMSIQVVFTGEKQLSRQRVTLEELEHILIHPRKNFNHK